MHPTIQRMQHVVAKGNEDDIKPFLAEDVTFQPPTYWATWTGRDAVAAVLGHVGQVFTEFRYRRIMGSGKDWALEFECKVGEFSCVGVDLIRLNEAGEIQNFEVAMRPYKTIGALREAMNARVMNDPRFLKFKDALN